ncbi:MAG: hypothetical protein WC299_01105 [Kiritimatiellia bacterium]
MSQNGVLRAWLKFNIHLAAVLIIPAAIVLPVIAFIAGQLAAIAVALFTAVLYTILSIIGIIIIGVILSGLTKRR